MELNESQEFAQWFNTESIKSKAQISARLLRIQLYDYFGDYKLLGDHLAELRWKNGRRIYFTLLEEKGKTVLLLLGGYKNAQHKDIKKAKALIAKYKKALSKATSQTYSN